MSNKPSVTLTIAGDADKLSRATTQATKSVDEMGDRVAKQSDSMASATEKHSGRTSAAMGVAAGAIGAFAITGVGHLFQLSKSMEALDVKAKTVFQDQLPDIQTWAEANRKAFGESTRNVVAMAANLADLLKPMGFTSAQAADMSKKILDLSGALSRWTGGTKTAAEVSEVLADAMLGETDGLKSLGISISAAEVDAKALQMGLGKTTVDMVKVRESTLAVERAQRALNDAVKAHGQGSLEARTASVALQKAQDGVKTAMAGGKAEIDDQGRALATQALILEKSTDAQAAWANGGREAAEKQNALSSTMAESAEKLAAIVAPVFEKLVTILAAVADWMSRNQAAAIAIVAVTAAVWLLNAALAANPIVLIVALVAGLVATLVIWWTQSETLRRVVTGVFTAIGETVARVAGWIVDRIAGVIDFFRNAPFRISEALAGVGSAIASAFKFGLNLAIDYLNFWVDRANNLIHGVNVINPFEDIPSIPRVARLHTGGMVPGMPGTETLVRARAGEHVSAPGQGGGDELRVSGSGALFEIVQAGISDGSIVLVGR